MGSQGEIPVAKEGELYSLKWQTYQGHISSGLQRLYTSNDTESLRDVTLGSEGQYVKAHKVILSLCSPYFRLLFQTNKAENGNMIIILEHLKFRDLKNVIHFIYNGEIKVKNSDLKGFLRAGELLQIEGLAKGNSEDNDDDEVSPPPTKSRRAGSTGATSFAEGSVSFLPQPSSSKSSTAASTMVHPIIKSTASTAATPSCNSQSVKRTRLGRVIKPTVPAIDYDDSNFSLEEEVETDLLALDSAVVTVQENNRLNTTTSSEQRDDGEVLAMNIKTEIPSDFFAIDSNDMDSTGLMHEETGDGIESDMYNQSFEHGDDSVAGPSSSAVAVTSQSNKSSDLGVGGTNEIMNILASYKRPRKRRSAIHEHFTFNPEDGRYYCNHCEGSYKKSATGSTSGLIQHLDIHHPDFRRETAITTRAGNATGKKYSRNPSISRNHFTLNAEDGRLHCNYCEVSYKKSSTHSTSGLNRHVRIHFKELKKRIMAGNTTEEKLTQSKSQTVPAAAVTLPSDSSSDDEIVDALISNQGQLKVKDVISKK